MDLLITLVVMAVLIGVFLGVISLIGRSSQTGIRTFTASDLTPAVTLFEQHLPAITDGDMNLVVSLGKPAWTDVFREGLQIRAVLGAPFFTEEPLTGPDFLQEIQARALTAAASLTEAPLVSLSFYYPEKNGLQTLLQANPAALPSDAVIYAEHRVLRQYATSIAIPHHTPAAVLFDSIVRVLPALARSPLPPVFTAKTAVINVD